MKKIGFGSLSFVLAIIAIAWSYEIMGFCLGDFILTTLNIPTWSNYGTSLMIYCTGYYAFLFIIPSIILSIKYKHDYLAQAGKWLSIIVATILIVTFLFGDSAVAIIP